MIKSVEIKNFKSIKQKYFPLRNLNVLLGLNGMGKSSFIQALLMLRQSYNNSLHNGRVELNGQFVNIGKNKDALYQYSKENLAFHVRFMNGKNLNLEFEYKREADYLITQEKNERDSSFKWLEENRSHKQTLFSNNFQYLNAHRIEPTSVHSKGYFSDAKILGNRGEYTAHYIEEFGSDDITFDNLLHKNSSIIDSVTGKNIVNKTLINQINLWMREISPDIFIRTTSINSQNVLLEYEFKQPNFGRTNKFRPENVGFGISYVLPVVTALLSAKKGELIIIENPESHIHPRGQAELGKLIALTAMNDVQIIIETHSDHILNGIRVAVKEKELSEEKVVVFYFDKVVEPSEQYSKITNIEIDKNGELSDYPKNILEEWSNQILKLI